MTQKWWLIAAGAVGIALAVLLFPKPNADALPDPDMSRANPLDFKAKPSQKRPEHVRVARRDLVSPGAVNTRHANMVGMAHLTTPEAIYAGRLSGPWTLIRRQLLAHGDDEAKVWAEQITQVVIDLRSRRRDPESVDWADLASRQQKLLDEVKGHSSWLEIEGVAAQVDRVEDLFVSFEQAKAAEAEGRPLPGPTPHVTSEADVDGAGDAPAANSPAPKPEGE